MIERRIAPLSVEEAVARGGEVRIHPDLARLEVMRALLHHPPLAKAIQTLLIMLLYKGRILDERLRELLIMRIAWRTASLYEWTQHWRVARDLGMEESDILGVRDWRGFAGYGRPERAVLAAVDETLDTGAVSPATMAECLRLLGSPAQGIELLAAIGNWRMFSQLLRTLRVPLEDGLAAWPPDGAMPPEPRIGVAGGLAGREGVDDASVLPLLAPDESARRGRELGLDDGQARRAPYRLLLQHPPLARALNGLLSRLLYNGVLDAGVRELVIMRTAWRTGSAVEWARHVPFCRRIGVSDADLLAVRGPLEDMDFSAAECAALMATDDTLETGAVGDDAWTACEAAFGTLPELLELVAAISHWRMYSQILRSSGAPHEEGDTVWAPDGRFPAG